MEEACLPCEGGGRTLLSAAQRALSAVSKRGSGGTGDKWPCAPPVVLSIPAFQGKADIQPCKAQDTWVTCPEKSESELLTSSLPTYLVYMSTSLPSGWEGGQSPSNLVSTLCHETQALPVAPGTQFSPRLLTPNNCPGERERPGRGGRGQEEQAAPPRAGCPTLP
ncbi:hypothetical protein CB1_000490087 [Camelus ferus]|nr:hypothetical protein CB1_000490087 [Camelus ferus]